MGALDSLLAGFDPGEMRDPMGRWMKGATSPRHGSFKIGDHVTHETGSRGAGGHGPVTFTRQPEAEAERQLEIRARMSSSSRERALAQVELERRRGARTARPRIRESVLGALVEGFAAAPAEDFPDHPFSRGDQVRVSVKGGSKSVVGRVMRPHGGPPATHAVVAPDGGGAHVLAKVGDVHLNTPAQHAASAKRQEREQARQEQVKAHSAWMAAKPAGSPPPAGSGVREGVSLLLEDFKPGERRDARGRWTTVTKAAGDLRHGDELVHPGGKVSAVHGSPVDFGGGEVGIYFRNGPAVTRQRTDRVNVIKRTSTIGAQEGLAEAFAVSGGGPPAETPAQSQAIGAGQVAAARKSLAAGWNASKHPRGQGGRFGYTTGGKRAKRGRASSSRTLGQGASGALVASIQRQLGISADGKYGPQTRSAVSRYQQVHHLQVDGVVGRQTLAALRGHVNPASVKPGPISSRTAALKPHPAIAKTPAKTTTTRKTRSTAARTRATPARAPVKAPVKAPVRVGGGIVV